MVAVEKRLEELRMDVLPILRRHRVKRAALFGFYAGGDAGKDSDIDILVEFAGGETGLLNLVFLKQELEEKLGRRVDVLTYDALNPVLKDGVGRMQVPVL